MYAISSVRFQRLEFFEYIVYIISGVYMWFLYVEIIISYIGLHKVIL